MVPGDLLALLIRAAGWAGQQDVQQQAAWAAVCLLPRLAKALQGLAADPSVQLPYLLWTFADRLVWPADPDDVLDGVPPVDSGEQLQVGFAWPAAALLTACFVRLPAGVVAHQELPLVPGCRRCWKQQTPP